MIVDSHTHILPDEFRIDRERILASDTTFRALFSSPKATSASAAELLAEMEQSGVDVSVTAGYGWTDFQTAQLSNDYLIESARDYPGKLIPLCSVNPLWGQAAIEEVERCAAAGARGIGELHPDTQNFLNMDFDSLAPFFDAARSLRLPVLMHTSEPVGHSYPGKGTITPEYSLALAKAFPANTFVFAHFGGGLPFYALMPEVRRELANVYFDSAAFPFLYRPEVFSVAGTAAGWDRILFASDFPLVRQQRVLDELGSASLADSDFNQITAKNAQRFWALH
jgi:predicted TIM-barrel fold metal-dependent hydrolase